MKYLAVEMVYDGGDAMGTHMGVVVEAPTAEEARELVDDMMKGTESPFWPDYAEGTEIDTGATEYAPDVREHGFYYNTIYDSDVYNEVISEGASEDEAFEASSTTVGVEPLSFKSFGSKKAATKYLEDKGLYAPYRLKFVDYPWKDSNPSDPEPTKKLKAKLLR